MQGPQNGDSTEDVFLRVKLELKMKQTWHSIGRPVDAHLLIVHWGFLDACLEVVFI